MTRARRALPAFAALLVLAGCGSDSSGPKVEGPGPPGKHVVYATHLAQAEEPQIVIADVDGSHVRHLADGYAPAVSPDGRYVAFLRCPRCTTSRSAKADLYLVGSAGGEPKRLVAEVESIRWAADSRTILAARAKELVVVSLAGRTRTLVQGHVFQPRYSPDGRHVVYDLQLGTIPSCGPKSDVYSVPTAGGRPRRLTRGGHSAFPVWGPGQIAFARYTSNCRIRTVWTMRTDGSAARALLQPPPAATRPGHFGLVPVAWLPGGRRLVGANSGEFGNDAVVIDARTGAVHPLGGPVDAVSRDGRWIVGTRSRAEFPFAIGILPVQGGRPRVIAGGRVCCADWNR